MMIAKCKKCNNIAQWWYGPGNMDDNWCDSCVPRGCQFGCTQDENGNEILDDLGRKQPCHEFFFESGGVTW